jgi:hypothetical protein
MSSQSFMLLSFFSKKFKTSLIAPREKSSTKIPLKKFIETAILSGDNQNPPFIG